LVILSMMFPPVRPPAAARTVWIEHGVFESAA
jgi:hypothetical protein